MLYGQRMLITDRGLNRAEIHSDTAYFFDENTRTEMRIVDGVFFDSQGLRDAVLTSRTGLYNQRLNSLEARGDRAARGDHDASTAAASRRRSCATTSASTSCRATRHSR